METIILPAEDPLSIDQALEVIQSGEPVAFPTDTVYGLGGLVFESESIDRLYRVKERDNAKAIPILLGDSADLRRLTREMNPIALRLAQRFWPGPLTLVVPRHPALPETISPDSTVGVRMPNHPVTLALLRRSGPLAVTSANLSGMASTHTAQEVLEQLEGRIPLILDGGHTPGGGAASTVVDCTGPDLVILRPGPISEDQLLAALN